VEAFEMREPGAGISRDIAKGEAVEHELDVFISKRHQQRVRVEGERIVEVAWAESSRKLAARQREEEDRSRLAICRHLEAVYAQRAAEWRRQGDALEGREATDERKTA
jgi:hypothetical protein